VAKAYRVGVIGFAHMHVNDLAAMFAKQPKAKVVACADTVPDRPELRDGGNTRGWNFEKVIKDVGAKPYDDYRRMLEKEKPDIVICCAENAKHAEVAEASAAAGAAICVEKPMAATLADALRMVRACRAAGTVMIINWPMTWDPAVRKARELIDAGAIGRVIEVKWRGGHTGPLGCGVNPSGATGAAAPLGPAELGAAWWHHDLAGGGAMLDYCCYGCLASRWFIGEQAQAAIGLRANLNSHWGDADDNAAMIVRFPGAMGLFEASWTTWSHGVPGGPIVYGTSGVLVIERKDGRPAVREEHGGGKPTVHATEPLPPGRDNIAGEFIHHLQTGDPVHPTLDMMFNLEVQAILDAGHRSASSGKLEPVDNVTWRMGL